MAVRLDKYRPVVTLMSGSVAVEFEHPRFITVFNALFDRFTSKPVLMLGSKLWAACRALSAMLICALTCAKGLIGQVGR